MHIDSGTLASTRFSSPGPIGLNEIEPNTILDQSKRELAFDIGQLILDITGIFDPSPISDGTSFLISLARGNWLDAATSAVSIVPYIGDLAKTAKLPRYLESVRKAIQIARLDFKWAHALQALFEKLKKVLDKGYELSADLLPDAAGKQLKALKDEIDDFLKPRGSAAGNPPEGGIRTTPRSSKPIKSTGDLEQPQTVGNLDKNATKGHGGNENNVGPKKKTKDPEKETPHGFDSLDDFKAFSKTANKELGKAGYKDATASLQGSAVTGKSFNTGKTFGPHSDFDIAISSESLFNNARKKGLEIGKNPSRIGPLSEKEIKILGLGRLQRKLINQSGGREVNFMLFKNQDKVLRWSADTIPLK